MFAFNSRDMEVFGAFGENLADVLTNNVIGDINDWNGYLAVKRRYLYDVKEDVGWSCKQTDFGDAATRDWNTWPSHGFLADLMAIISDGRDSFDVDDTTKSAADQLQHYELDGDAAFKAVE
jgi:hypothetical protein